MTLEHGHDATTALGIRCLRDGGMWQFAFTSRIGVEGWSTAQVAASEHSLVGHSRRSPRPCIFALVLRYRVGSEEQRGAAEPSIISLAGLAIDGGLSLHDLLN